MLRLLKRTALLTGLIGFVVGVIVVLAAEQFDHYTSTDTFCTSCHTMQEYIATSDTYLNSTHRTAPTGVRPGCADCHIPKGLLPATWAHIASGVKDVYAELRYDYAKPDVWKQRRTHLAYGVRDWMRANDSVTCRSCHEQAAINPARKRGQREHTEAQEKHMTCIDCHYNLVHDAIEPRDSFLQRAAGNGNNRD